MVSHVLLILFVVKFFGDWGFLGFRGEKVT